MAATKAKREAAALFLAVFLLGTLVGGVGVYFSGEGVWGETKPINITPTRAQMIEGYTRELQLTTDQQKQMVAIIDDTRAKWAALYAPLVPQKEQIGLDGWTHIRAILTSEQQVKFDGFMRRVDEQRKKDAKGQAAAGH